MRPGTVAKVTPPKLSNYMHRRRLYRLLDSKSDNDVIWISGPGGSGKTTLVRGYIDHLKLPCMWYQVDQGDIDPASFFYHLGMAIRQAVPRLRKPFPLLTPEYFPSISVFATRFFETLYNRLNPPAVIVLDNYQDVAEDQQIPG